DVGADVLDEVQPVLLAVLGDVGDAGVDRVGDGAHPHRSAVHVGGAGDVPAVGLPEHAHRELGAACAHQPGDAHDLAGAHGERGLVHDGAAGLGGMADVPVLDPE